MNAYVIDQKQLKRYVVEIVVALVIAFSLGFVLGMQQSKVDNEIAQSKHDKSVDQKAQDNADARTPQADAKKSATGGKETKISAAEKIKLAKEKTAQEKINLKEQQKIAQEKLALKKLAEKKLAKQKLEKERLAKQKRAKEKLEKEKQAKAKLAREKLAKEKQAKAEQEKKKQEASSTQGSGIAPPTVKPVDQTQSNQRVFSIQAGMFASKSNAESFIKKLEAKQFEAYVSDFQSSSGTTKYNVRVGRFDNREKARGLLKEFQKSFSTPAYVVIAQ